jgi:hypothetical protein
MTAMLLRKVTTLLWQHQYNSLQTSSWDKALKIIITIYPNEDSNYC